MLVSTFFYFWVISSFYNLNTLFPCLSFFTQFPFYTLMYVRAAQYVNLGLLLLMNSVS